MNHFVSRDQVPEVWYYLDRKPIWLPTRVANEVKKAQRQELLVSVRADLDFDDWVEVHTMSLEEWDNYQSNGGVWDFIEPDEWLSSNMAV